MRTIDLQHIRQLNITRQHLDTAKRPPLLDLIRDLGCLQLDPISAVQRSHMLVLWSRLGDYDPKQIDKLIYEDKVLFEYWAHEASIVLSEDYPLHRIQMRHYPGDGSWGDRVRQWLNSEAADLRESMLTRFRDEGALPSRVFEDKTRGALTSTGWNSDRNASRMLQHLWHSGQIGVARREGIQRYWDLLERCLPADMAREEWDSERVVETAAQRAIRALGVARPEHIKLHFIRNRYPELAVTLKKLTQNGVIEAVTITKNGQTLSGSWYIHTADIPLLERIQSGDWTPRTTLLSPFDNLICDRKRLALLFDFDYRVEIYTPQAKRQYGYYVLPILHGDRLIGRIDPRYDRKQKTFVIHHIHAEPNAPTDAETVTAIGEAIRGLASWLGAKTINVGTVPQRWEALTSV